MSSTTLTSNDVVPTSINHLPTEIHISIFKFLFALSRQESPVNPSHYMRVRIGSFISAPAPPPPVKFEWIEKDVRSPSLFPFNVASVSKLWHDIIALIPECWTRVIFDVAMDPTPLLNAFLWSTDLENIEVTVFNSDDPQIVDKTLERSRVAAIAQALQPHTFRCKSIIFDVSYSTSLPPPTMFFLHNAPRLQNLTLNCCVDDVDLGRDVRATETSTSQQHLATSFPCLTQVSLTGFWFMYLAERNLKWLNELKIAAYLVSLTVSHFKFPKRGRYTLPKFMSYVSAMHCARSFHFRDLSLSYSYRNQKCTYVYEVFGNVHFQSVSKDFLSHLHAITNVCTTDELSFEACEIPKMHQPHSGRCLTLKNIIDDNKGSSLRHILDVWTGSELNCYSCPSFSDAILFWLTSGAEHPGSSNFPAPITASVKDMRDHFQQLGIEGLFEELEELPAPYLSSLAIIECDNFSTHALKELILRRNELYERLADNDDSELAGMEFLHVTANRGGPILTDDDKRWFQYHEEFTTVSWVVQDDQGRTEVFNAPEESFKFSDGW